MESFIFPVLIGIAIFILGIFAGRFSKSYKTIGRFKINEGDPTKPAFWLEFDHDLDVIERQDTIGFKVFYHYPPEE